VIRIALLLHLLAVVFWVGGMAFAHFALRPALTKLLEPPQRLRVFADVLHRFLRAVAGAIAVIIVTGIAMLVMPGGSQIRPSIHAMIGIGILMIVIFGLIRFRSYPAMRRAMAAQNWPGAGASAAIIRQLVGINLALGTLVITIVLLAR
jgi:uncharacterized membrane protein